jgi:hypothetical protein
MSWLNSAGRARLQTLEDLNSPFAVGRGGPFWFNYDQSRPVAEMRAAPGGPADEPHPV